MSAFVFTTISVFASLCIMTLALLREYWWRQSQPRLAKDYMQRENQTLIKNINSSLRSLELKMKVKDYQSAQALLTTIYELAKGLHGPDMQFSYLHNYLKHLKTVRSKGYAIAGPDTL